MADISKITLPSGTTYDIKDAVARSTAGGGLSFKGVTTTEISDGSTVTSYVVNGETLTAANGDFVIYDKKEFVYTTSDNKWHELGDTSDLGDLAYKDDASGSYTPAGTVSQPTFTGSSMTATGTLTPSGSVTVATNATENKTATVSPAGSGDTTYTPAGSVSTPTISVSSAGSTATIHNPTKATVATAVTAAAPGASAPSNSITYYAVANETLSLYQIGYNTGDSISTSDVTVKTGDASYTASQPSFTGTGVRLVTGNIAVPSTYTASFTGAEASVSVTGTPEGTVSQPSFSGTEATITVS